MKIFSYIPFLIVTVLVTFFFSTLSFLSVNMATAEAIDFTVPESIKKIARDVYDQ